MLPPRLERIVAASLAKDPAGRPPTGRPSSASCSGTARRRQRRPTAATQVLRPRKPGRSRQRAVVPIAGVAALLLVAGGALAIILTNKGSDGGTAPPTALTLPNVPSAPSTTAATAAGDDRSRDDGAHHDDRAHDHGRHDRHGDHAARDHAAGDHHRAGDDGSGHDHGAAGDDRRSAHDDRRYHDGGRHDRSGHDHRGRAVKALYFGTYDRAHPRNVNAIAALRAVGVEVDERQVAVRGGGLAGALNDLRRRVAAARAAQARLRRADRRLPGPLRRAASAPFRRRATARLRRGAVARERARRRAAPLPRPLHRSERSARRRLPRPPPAGSRRLRQRRGSPLSLAARSQADGVGLSRRRRGRLLRDLVAGVPVQRAAHRRRLGRRRPRGGGLDRDAGPRRGRGRDRPRRTAGSRSRTRGSSSAAFASHGRSRPSSSRRSPPAHR